MDNLKILLVALFVSSFLYADPFPKIGFVFKNPKDFEETTRGVSPENALSAHQIWEQAEDVIRVQVDWIESSDSYRLAFAVIEKSGTPGLLKRTLRKDPLGSYHGELCDVTTGEAKYFNALGTGQEYRKLSRAMTFRFPLVEETMEFKMYAENPQSGDMELVLRQTIHPGKLERLPQNLDNIEVRLLKSASKSPKIFVNVYAEGYTANRKEQFWRDAPKVPDRLIERKFPMVEHMEFRAVFAPSNLPLGSAKKLGNPVPERDSFLGLYYPYWDDFGRWYHVIYPTREARFRKAIGSVSYDYPIALVDSSSYWGVGNFKEHTAIPAQSTSFTYLLLHEFGHYFGLNEEYESGGKTELAFAPGIKEPWSQNITFLRDSKSLKWAKHIGKNTPIPTPSSYWNGNGPYGAYPGGYAQTPPYNQSHKPGFGCIMNSSGTFCPICSEAIVARIMFDMGE